MSDEGFLQRWSRRKRGRVEAATSPHPDRLPQAGEGAAVSPLSVAEEAERAAVLPLPPAGEGRGEGLPEEPPPSLDDVAALPTGADIRRFLAPQVDEDVKRAAFKKLFADPRFNVMDGLDTYIDDYNKADPLPESMLRKMAQAQFLGLFDDEEKPKASPDGAPAPGVPQSATVSPAVPPDEDPDLRLQQDDAAGSGGTGEGPPA